MAEAEFTTFKNSSHTGMPTLVLENNDKQHLLAGGYANFETLDARLKKVLNL
jgi:protein-disulfide isomerase-like protein with CxxC motif